MPRKLNHSSAPSARMQGLAMESTLHRAASPQPGEPVLDHSKPSTCRNRTSSNRKFLFFPPSAISCGARCIHIGTHGQDVHPQLHKLFVENSWQSYSATDPIRNAESALATFETNDGVLTLRNPTFSTEMEPLPAICPGDRPSFSISGIRTND